MRRAHLCCLLVLGGAIAAACATAAGPFDRYMEQQRWSDAARAFAADSSLRDNEHALYEAGVLYGSPGLPTYDPALARDLFQRLLTKFPTTSTHADASARLALLNDVLNTRRDAATRAAALQSRVAELSSQIDQLRAQLDSANAQRRDVVRLEADLRERDEQLRALRLELERLKAIDLKRKPPL